MFKRAGLACIAAICLTTYARAADAPPTTAPAPTPAQAATAVPATAPARTAEQLKGDLQAAFAQVHDAMKDPRSLLDPKLRAAAAPQLLPGLQKVLRILNEINQVDPASADDSRSFRYETMAFLDLLGDADTSKALDTAAAGKDPVEANAAKSAKFFSAWLRTSTEAAAQGKVLDSIQELAKANPKDDSLARTLYVMSNLGGANDDNSKRAVDIIVSSLNGDVAEEIIARKKESDSIEGNLKAMENKPILVTGKTVDGKNFSSADWKGKVVLVDFWATWCGPCRAELPNVKKLYTDYHAKGLEIVGVSCDRAADDLTSFLKDDGNMPWPQIFELDASGQNPVAAKFGIDEIPTMFVIDKNGVLRSVDGRDTAKELVPKLLDEAVKTTPSPAPVTAPATQK